MQETFALRKTLRKVAAVGTSVAMLGMTLTGALAQDRTLADYPAPFTTNTVVVVGSAADPADNTAAADITFGLGGSSTPSDDDDDDDMPQTQLQWNGGQLEDIPLNRSLIDPTDGFTANLTDSDIDGFKDSTIKIDIGDVDDDYNFHEEVRLTNTARVETGLTYDSNRDEDFKENIFIPMLSGSFGYYYVFDENLRAGNYISNATQTDPINIEFLGKNLEIIGIANDVDSLTINVGQEFRLNAGDCVQASGSEGSVKVCLRGTSSTKAEVDIGGTVEVISQDSSKTRHGVEVRVEDVFDEEGTSLDSATVFVGEDARKTYNDGQEFIGEDEDDPIWVWDLGALTGVSPTLGVTLDLNIDSADEEDNAMVKHPLYEGEYLCLPWNYACVINEGPTEDDDNFMEYTLDAESKDLYFSQADADSGNAANRSSAKVLRFTSGGNNDGFRASGLDTDTVWVAISSSGNAMELYRKEQDGSKAIRFFNGTGTNTALENVFQLDPGTSNIQVSFRNMSNLAGSAEDATTLVQMHMKIQETANSNFSIAFEESAQGEITYVGQTDGDTDKAWDLAWNVSGRAFDISGFEENTRGASGVIVDDPDANAAGDRVIFRVPQDPTDFKINVRVAQPKGVGSGGPVVYRGAISGVASRLDSEVLDNLTDWNVIAVGGPAINEVTADLKGLNFPAYGAASGINPGEAVIELMRNGNNWALIAAGYEKENTRAAGIVLKNYDDYSDKLEGTSVVVKGVEATGITVA